MAVAFGERVVAEGFVSPNLLFSMFSFGCDDRGMSSDAKIDYQREAMAAMKMAVASDGFERLKWVRVAQAWQDLGRGQDMGRWTGRRDVAALSPSMVRAEHD